MLRWRELELHCVFLDFQRFVHSVFPEQQVAKSVARLALWTPVYWERPAHDEP